jgi:hypothetical protein
LSRTTDGFLRTSVRAGATASLAAALLAVAAFGSVVLGAVPARASTSEESSFQDDNLLEYSTPQIAAHTLGALRAMGVDRIRVSVFWRSVAPDSQSKTRPRFDAADPGAYPPGSWDRYDRIVTLARSLGLAVNLDITDPAPLWATGSPQRADIEKTYTPSATEFGQFVQAVAKRYSGSFVAPTPTLDPSHPGPPRPLPRVDFWSIWNEPNQPGWLTPQWLPDSRQPGGFLEVAPTLYRGLLDAAWSALLATGHGSDTIVVGETAPKGLHVKGLTRAIKALHFIRQLYCLDDSSRPLQGAAAAARSCPATAADSRRFPVAHPALFAATGWSHHPYELTFAPTVAPIDRDFVTIANLGRLSAALQTIFKVYGVTRPPMPLYLTEFGYQSNPPSPIGVTLAEQAAYLNESEFVAYTNPQVRMLSQFLLNDDMAVKGNDLVARLGATFQTGLRFHNGRDKPALVAYRLPIYVPEPRIARGHTLRVWGFVREAPRGVSQRVAIQFRALRSRRAFRTIATVGTDPARGYLDVRVRVHASGVLRLQWQRPGSPEVLQSRVVGVRVR